MIGARGFGESFQRCFVESALLDRGAKSEDGVAVEVEGDEALAAADAGFGGAAEEGAAVHGLGPLALVTFVNFPVSEASIAFLGPKS